MQFDLTRPIVTARAFWTDLERDWQSVTIGAAIVTLVVLLEIPIPW